jgi:hypothetical protein
MPENAFQNNVGNLFHAMFFVWTAFPACIQVFPYAMTTLRRREALAATPSTPRQPDLDPAAWRCLALSSRPSRKLEA